MIKIEEDMCISCGACENVSPEYFEVTDVARVIKEADKLTEDIQDAIDACPVDIITFEE